MTYPKIVVWDLFGGGQNSVYEALKDNTVYDIYTFDVTKPTRDKQYVLDLSQDHILKDLWQLPKPDIIVASPLCQSFSSILTMKGGGTCFWKKENGKLVERSVEEFESLKSGFTRNLKADHQLFIKKLGEKCLLNTFKIIEYFKPTCWYIENPENSLIWYYIKNNLKKQGYFNKATYGLYGFLSAKNTIFFSNVELNLKYGQCPKKYKIKKIKGKKYYVLLDNPKIKIPVTGGRSTFLERSAYVGKMLNNDCNAKIKKSDIVRISKAPKQNEKMDNHQVCEAGAASAIPHELIQDIFRQFQKEWFSSHSYSIPKEQLGIGDAKPTKLHINWKGVKIDIDIKDYDKN